MASTLASQEPLPFIHPDDMPDRYALTGRGTCMLPLVQDGAILVMDKTQVPEVGDTVTLVFTPEAARRHGMPGIVKRLSFTLPPSRFADMGQIMVEQLNPPRPYAYSARDVLAVHKCIGFAESGGGGQVQFRVKQEPPRATPEMLAGGAQP